MSKKGFTLIELLIVVAIIGILATIAVPVYRDVTVKAEISKSLSELRSMRADAVFGHSEYRDTELRVAGYDGVFCKVEKVITEKNSSKILISFYWALHVPAFTPGRYKPGERQDYFFVRIEKYERESDAEWQLNSFYSAGRNPSVQEIFELYREIAA